MPTVRVPINLTNPRVTSLAGNAWFGVAGLTNWDAGVWNLKRDVEGRVYGIVYVPANVAGTPAAGIILDVAANATSGVTRLNVATFKAADGASLNGAFTAETAQDITVPATAYNRKTVTFPATGNIATAVAANDLLVVQITHDGAHANDTLAAETLLFGALLRVDV